MDITARIRRRQRKGDEPRLVQDYQALSPVAHVDEPSGRGPVFEQLLDHLDPVFDGGLPPNAYVCGPAGAGKSAVLTALVTHLRRLSTESQSVIHTSTRASAPASPGFVYVDVREASSEFAFYRRVFDGLVDESVPEHGISTAELRGRLDDLLSRLRAGVVVAVDHVCEPNSADAAELVDRFAGLPSNVSWLAVGRVEPEETELTRYTANTIHVAGYRKEMLVDVLMTRASAGLSQQALDYEQSRYIAEWAAGNAHDALAALFAAADLAERAGRARLSREDVEAAIADIPRPSVSLGRVLALPANKQAVLRELLDLTPEQRGSVTDTTTAISAGSAVDLSAGTIKRFLYEMAEDGIVERVKTEARGRKGRPPSRLEPRFPTLVFRQLYDRQRR